MKYVSEIRVAACNSTVATVASNDNKQVDSVLCKVKTTNKVTRSPTENLESIFIVEDCSLPVRAFIDPGSNHSFMTIHVCV